MASERERGPAEDVRVVEVIDEGVESNVVSEMEGAAEVGDLEVAPRQEAGFLGAEEAVTEVAVTEVVGNAGDAEVAAREVAGSAGVAEDEGVAEAASEGEAEVVGEEAAVREVAGNVGEMEAAVREVGGNLGETDVAAREVAVREAAGAIAAVWELAEVTGNAGDGGGCGGG